MTERAGRSWTLTLPYDKPPLSLNSRMHFRKEAQWKRQIKDDVGWLARAAKLPRNELRRVLIQLVWTPSMKRDRDTDNPTATLKPAIDGLVRYGLVPDDNRDVVESNCIIRSHVSGRGKLELVITELLPDTVVNTPE